MLSKPALALCPAPTAPRANPEKSNESLLFCAMQVVATAGAVAVRFILQNTHHSRYVPIILLSLNNKSKDIRRATCEYLHLILQSWQTSLLQKHVNILQDGIKRGMADSDVDARAFARKYVTFNFFYQFKKL